MAGDLGEMPDLARPGVHHGRRPCRSVHEPVQVRGVDADLTEVSHRVQRRLDVERMALGHQQVLNVAGVESRRAEEDDVLMSYSPRLSVTLVLIPGNEHGHVVGGVHVAARDGCLHLVVRQIQEDQLRRAVSGQHLVDRLERSQLVLDLVQRLDVGDAALRPAQRQVGLKPRLLAL